MRFLIELAAELALLAILFLVCFGAAFAVLGEPIWRDLIAYSIMLVPFVFVSLGLWWTMQSRKRGS